MFLNRFLPAVLINILVPLTALKGQSMDKVIVTLELNNESLESCFKFIERQTGLLFAYIPDHVDPYTSITLPKGSWTVREVLDMVLKDTPLTFDQMESSIVVFKRRDGTAFPVDNSPPTLVTGKVVDENGNLMTGVNVLIKGVGTGTVTNKGQYSILARSTDTLVFSFVGFKTALVPIKNRTTFDLVLKSEIPLLKEVEVNAGYWTVKEREQTGNIVRIDAEKIHRQPVSNPLVALAGHTPGVFIQQLSGVVGGGVNIQIRGINSLRADGNNPLIIIDGVPYTAASMSSKNIGGEILNGANPLNNISPNDIKSIDILKDADATAIYGSRGANGVILITTKKGISGKSRVEMNFYQGSGEVTRTMKLLNTEQWLEMRKEAFRNDNATMSAFTAPDLLVWDTTRYTDWTKTLIGNTACITSAHGSLSGGDEATQYFFSATYYRESSAFPGNFAFQKGSAHAHFNHTSPLDDGRLKFSISSNYTVTDNHLPRTDPTTKAIELAPNAPPIYDEEGNLNWADGTWINPFALLRQEYKSFTTSFINNGLISYELAPGLRIRSNFGYTRVELEELSTEPISSFNPLLNRTGRSFFGNNSISTWIVEPQLEYTRTNLGKGKLIVLVGSTFQESINKIKNARATGYQNDALIENLLAAPQVYITVDDFIKYRYNALFGRINYTWDEKYILNLTGRRDGSSRFGPGNQFANFGAIGAAWIFSREEFLGNKLPFLSFGKIRASYGITGSDQIGDYGYLNTYASTQYIYNGMKGMIPERLLNLEYSWETNVKFETSLDIGLFDNRILLNTSYYRNRSSNQLVGYSLPVITGQPMVQANLDATVQNKGWEFLLNTVNVAGKNFTWKTSLNLTIPKNKLINYPNLAGSTYANQYEIGQPMTIQKKYKYTGVDPETGVYTFEDVNGDGMLSAPQDYQALKKVGYDWYGGIHNNFQYKNITLDVFFQVVKQTGYNYLNLITRTPGTRFTNHPVQVMDRWTHPGDISEIQAFTQRTNQASTAYHNLVTNSDGIISDASFMRLKNISLSYHFKAEWLEIIKLREGRIFVQGQNLLTFTNYLGNDPENMAEGTLPPLRVISAGIHLTF